MFRATWLLLAVVLLTPLAAPRAARGQAFSPPPSRPRAPRDASSSPPTGAASGAASGNTAQAQLTILRQSRFSIPIIRPQGDPLAVELHVSVDQGKSWRPYAKEPPTSKAFVFDAPSDGEYWFASRTHFRQGVWPTGAFKPEVKVQIDTAEPRLDFQAFVGGAGEIVVQWSMADPNLSPESFALSYQPGPEQNWRPIALDDEQNKGNLIRGQRTWWPMTNAKVVYVRAQVSDKARNTAVVERRLFLPKIARRTSPGQNPPGPIPPGRGSPDATESRTSVAARDPVDPRPAGSIPWTEGRPGPTSPLVQGAVQGSVEVAGGGAGRGGPPPQLTKPAPAYAQDARVQDDRVSGSSGGSGRGFDRTGESDWESRGGSEQPRHPPVAGEVQPPVSRRVAPVARTVEQANGQFLLPQGEQARTTKSQRFSLDYDIDSVGPSGVAKVELWQTIDGGANWRRRQYDDDLQSPIDVEVEGEGVYGFRIVIVGKNGLASRTPRAGDLADLWIAVDMSPPESRLTSATYGRGARVGQLDIRWDAKDSWLGERPVTLKFSDTFDGPWTTIATGLANSGQYFWTAGARTPPKIYLRLEVRDRAGNLAVDQLREAISVEGLSPRGRIRGFRPLDDPDR